jgi:hypothetical protein
MIELIKTILDLFSVETFWYIFTLNLCVIGVIYVLIRPLLKAHDLEKWDDIDR